MIVLTFCCSSLRPTKKGTGASSPLEKPPRDFLTMFNDFDYVLEMRKHGATHKDSNLLNDFNAGMTSLPRLFASTDSLQKRKKRGYTQGRRNNSKSPKKKKVSIYVTRRTYLSSPSRCVSHVFVNVVDVRTHCRYHSS